LDLQIQQSLWYQQQIGSPEGLQEAAEKLKSTVSDEKLLNERIEYASKVLDAAHPNFSIDKKIESIVQEEFESYMSGQK